MWLVPHTWAPFSCSDLIMSWLMWCFRGNLTGYRVSYGRNSALTILPLLLINPSSSSCRFNMDNLLWAGNVFCFNNDWYSWCLILMSPVDKSSTSQFLLHESHHGLTLLLLYFALRVDNCWWIWMSRLRWWGQGVSRWKIYLAEVCLFYCDHVISSTVIMWSAVSIVIWRGCCRDCRRSMLLGSTAMLGGWSVHSASGCARNVGPFHHNSRLARFDTVHPRDATVAL